MSRQRKDPTKGEAIGTRARGGAKDLLKDASAKDLAKLAQKLGNDRVQAMVRQSTGKRDALLEFVRERLAQVKAAQQAELQAMNKSRVWFDEVARDKKGFGLPDPTRWRGAALLYKRATEALCAGDLGRGAQLLDKAAEAERAAWDTVPAQVDVPDVARKPADMPAERVLVEAGEGCPQTHAPAVLKEAQEIVNVSDRSSEQPMPRAMARHEGWWDVEEDDAEKAEGDDDKKKKKKKGKPDGS
ncbi:MAG: hypothetical protein ACOZNI_02835 [Myxococcota bacterium]